MPTRRSCARFATSSWDAPCWSAGRTWCEFECVARGYLSGSGWKDFRPRDRVRHPAPPACARATNCPSRSSRPRRRRETGHDENIPFERVVGLIGETSPPAAGSYARHLSRRPPYAETRGIIIADTKFEFGFVGRGTRFRRRSADAGFVALLAARRTCPAGLSLVRQAVCARLPGIDPMEQTAAGSRTCLRSGAADKRQVYRGVPCPDREGALNWLDWLIIVFIGTFRHRRISGRLYTHWYRLCRADCGIHRGRF